MERDRPRNDNSAPSAAASAAAQGEHSQEWLCYNLQEHSQEWLCYNLQEHSQEWLCYIAKGGCVTGCHWRWTRAILGAG